MCFGIFNYKSLLNENNAGDTFSFKGKCIYAKCVDVYDGDTITVKFFYRRELLKYKVRLLGLDTPELKTKNLEEKQLSQKIKGYVSELIMNKIIKLKCYEFDKYGRILAEIFFKSEKEYSLNNFLIENRLAIKYNGDTKQIFSLENYNQTDIKLPITKNYSLWNYISLNN